MSASFIPAVSSSQLSEQVGAHSNSPPSLTNSSSPTSSDSTGEEDASTSTAKSRKRAQNPHRTAAATNTQAPAIAPLPGVVEASLFQKTGFPQVINADTGFSHNLWNKNAQSFVSGFDASALEQFDSTKGGFDTMNFGSWDGNFANLAVPSDADVSMDMDSTAGTDYGFSPSSFHSPASSHNAAMSFTGAANVLSQDSPSGSDSKTGSRSTAPPTVASSSASFAGSGEESDGVGGWTAKLHDNDEAMFDSFVQDGSFEPLVSNGKSGGLGAGAARSFASMTIPTSAGASVPTVASSSNPSKPSMMPPAPPNTSKTVSVGTASKSAASSRRNSGESSEPRKASTSTATRRHGSQTAVNSNNLDADLGYSAFEVVRPAREGLQDLQVHIHGVPMHGAKSRVETQIRMRIELVRPRTASAGGWERIGSFTHIKLPPLSGTKRKSKKYQKTDVPPEKTLFVDATVVNATPPHDRVFVCKGCRQRERKRAHRKKDPKDPLDLRPTEEEMRSLGIDPAAPDAVERTQARMEEEEKKRVVLFNCGDYVDFDEGEAVLPTRITCYCRHHKEKVGFCVIFTMRDWQGRLIATGSTPPIMITDDHKSMGIAAQAAQAAAAGSGAATQQPQGVIKQVNGHSPRNQMEDAQANGSTSGSATPNGCNSTDVPQKSRKERSKPYDAGRRRRNTSTKELNMTPHSGTGQNTPALSATSPSAVSSNAGASNGSVDFSSADLWNAFGAAPNANAAASGLGRSNSTSTGTKTPGETPSLGGSPTPLGGPVMPSSHPSMPPMPPALQAQLAQGSLSPTTLQTNLSSLPSFDLEQFFRNAQAGVSNGVDFAQLMAMAAAAALPAHMRQNVSGTSSMSPAGMQGFAHGGPSTTSGSSQAPVPRISKLIPGEGPTSGGIEVTVLGENFTEGISCVFGDVPASNTKVWASNTLVCILPPSASPGPVVVSLKGVAQIQPPPVNGPLQLFTYIDTTDRALMELALQVVGLQMTGQMRSAREVAMRVVGSGGGHPNVPASFPTGSGNGSGGAGANGVGHSHAREAVAGLFAARAQSSNFQDSVVQFLSLLDADLDAERIVRRDAIRLANGQGHTLLHLATMMGFHRLVDFLVRRGCPLDARDRNGATALHFAAIQGRLTIARLLLRNGARDDVEDANGLFAIDLAREHDQVDVEELLDNTARTGHWQTRRVSSHVDSGLLQDQDDDLLSDDVSSEASLSDVDEDNVSTSFDEYSDDSFSLSEDDERDSADEAEDERDALDAQRAVADLPTPQIDEKATLKSAASCMPATEGSAKLSKQEEARLDRPALKSWLTKAGDTGVASVDWMNRKLLPQTVADRFAQLHMPAMPQMPAISVFHLSLPAASSMPLLPWAGATRSENGKERAADFSSTKEDDSADEIKGKARQPDADHRPQSGWESDERSRLLTLWRNIVDEGAWTLNPLYSPPPAYESVASALSPNETVQSETTLSTSAPAVATRSASVSECSTPVAGPSRRPSTKRRTTASELATCSSLKAGAQAATSSSTATGVSQSCKSRAGHAQGGPSPTGATATASRRRNAPRTLRDDAMLVWFWIPVLLVVVVLLLFSKSSSILSLADLRSYLELDLPAVGRLREVQQ